MSRDGSGTYSLPAGNPVVTGTTISSTTHNTTLTDIANALTASIAKDGQTTPTANLPMGTYRHTGVSNGTARDQYAALAQLQDGGAQYVGSVSGTDTITGSLTPAIAAYATGMVVVLTPANTNTGAATLALNGLSAKNILTPLGGNVSGGALRAGYPAVLVYDGTRFILVSPDVASGTFTGTLTGCTTSPTASISYRRTGHMVTIYFPNNLVGTSNSTELTVTGLPSALAPAGGVVRPISRYIQNNSLSVGGDVIIPASSTTMTFAILTSLPGEPNNSGFTSSGGKGILAGLSFHYSLT